MARAAAAAALVAVSGCTTPKAQAAMAEAINDAGTAVAQMQEDLSDLHSTVDSLQIVVAHQDTIIAKLANLANLPTR
jgi:hypothetical protein